MKPSESQSSFTDPLQAGSSSTASLHVQPASSLPPHISTTLLSSTGSPLSPSLHEKLHPYHEPYTFLVNITGTRLAGSALLFRFTGETNLACYPISKMDCERSFQDFEKLASHLIKYRPYNILPGLPPMSTKTDAKTKAVMEKYLKRLTLHPLVVRDPSFVSFMTSPAEFHPFVPSDIDALLPSLSWSSKLKSLVRSKPKDIDVHLEQARQKTAEQVYCLKAMQKLVEKFTSSHKALANAYLDFSTKIQGFAVAETNPSLSGKWTEFGKRMQTISQAYNEQATAENYVMKDVLVTELNSCNNLQLALDHRLQALSLYDDACRDTERHKRRMERLRSGGQGLSAGKVTSSVEQLESKHEVETRSRLVFKMASEYILRDLVAAIAAWESNIDAAMADWAHVQLEAERRVAQEVWARPESTSS